MSCCPPDSEPARETAAHVGTITRYGNTKLYVAGPRTASVGVIAVPDIFGVDSGRTKEDADRLGHQLGYAVVVVDVVHGDWLDPIDFQFKLALWNVEKDYDSVIAPTLQDAVDYLQQVAKVDQVCSYGYCFGAWVGARLCAASTTPVVKGHVSFHPSWAIENRLLGEGAIEKLAERVNAPQLLLAGENDIDAVSHGGCVHKILKGRAEVAALSDAIDFPDVKHGWVNRGDVSDPTVKASVDKAWELARSFFQTVCAQ